MIDDKRIRWRCRRGMKELDVLMERYLAAGYPALSDREKDIFSRVLNEKDPDLFGWLTGRSLPEDPEIAGFILLMRPVVSAKSG